jgi:hypothetical protein
MVSLVLLLLPDVQETKSNIANSKLHIPEIGGLHSASYLCCCLCLCLSLIQNLGIGGIQFVFMYVDNCDFIFHFSLPVLLYYDLNSAIFGGGNAKNEAT